MIEENWTRLKEDVSRVCRQVGRDPNDIIIVGATKYADANQIRTAVKAGMRHIGENRVQDAREKFRVLSSELAEVRKHMIGHLQSNKVKLAVELFDSIDSADSFKLVQAIERCSGSAGKIMDVFIQVNTSGEEQKSGIPAQDAEALIEQCKDFSNIRIVGLMTVGPLTEDQDQVRVCFRELRKIFASASDHLSTQKNLDLQYLSMGMTHDYPLAIEEGANLIRIGSAIFKS